ncbi:hypothetical protein HS99_0009250 [Kitasatospora aureofaciens]|uniref:Uncharacterized protein n=1 Tax=Kitasatospora aureofaciens TaxID=1894 RepID=A0A1E7N1U5_KITAU|nr:hypothetical protein B6264_26525 [Kitasatospora aureofaciens]OEV34668.1 hypothetical protein HS99_0009250 [Kitasatospora aureofaciens]
MALAHASRLGDEAGCVSIMSEDPVSADRVYAALVALRRERILDPELWPDGPQQGDLRRLLGALLAS